MRSARNLAGILRGNIVDWFPNSWRDLDYAIAMKVIRERAVTLMVFKLIFLPATTSCAPSTDPIVYRLINRQSETRPRYRSGSSVAGYFRRGGYIYIY